MKLDDLEYLWDGSDPGWQLHRIDSQVWRLIFRFAQGGPSNQEIIALRKVVPEFKKMKLLEVVCLLKGEGYYDTPDIFNDKECNNMAALATNLGLKFEIITEQSIGYLPVSKDNYALLIEDEELSLVVCEKMLEAGVPVVTTEQVRKHMD
ncbi:hypothetical protein [Pleionea sp. CnH1-48]|uniref:hypothetical protein n=1 Tax=Pleionea sp. CnH1-48 TaxID=2954494 RepID=UPI002097C367|nr:hypothetical protein [Pleionea sp. CnH1-48]MCO7223377.1 hypothetical protein [Pleionea sp. CnH1-48]